MSISAFDESRQINYYPVLSYNENPSIASLYEARIFFKDETIPYVIERKEGQKVIVNGEVWNLDDNGGGKITFSDLQNENVLYGIVDENSNLITVNTDESYLNSISVNNSKNVRLQNFVADAFIDMTTFLKRSSMSGKLSVTSPYANMAPTLGFQYLSNLYDANGLLISNNFKKFVLGNSSINFSIKNAKDFNKYYIEYLTNLVSIIPATRASTSIYFRYSAFCSGLMLKIANEDAGNDTVKYTDYFLDSDFNCFIDACKRFGFKIDKNIPWILMADLKSPAMKKYMEKYDIQNLKQLFNERYKKLYLDDIKLLKRFFYLSYDVFLVNNSVYEENYNNLCSNSVSKNTLKRRNPISFLEYEKLFPYKYWIRLYAYLRYLETGLDISQQEFDISVKKAIDLHMCGNDQLCSKAIDDMFKKDLLKFIFPTLQTEEDLVEQRPRKQKIIF